MIYMTGDTHGEFERFSNKNFPEHRQLTRDDYVIICGDFGGVWCDVPEQRYWLDWLEKRNFTLLFVDGNHENYDMLNAIPVTQWHGGNVHMVRPHVIHLMRGQVFDIDGHSFFTMGGAASHDISGGILDPNAPNFESEYWFKRRTRQAFRVKGVSWWPEELPSEAEYAEARAALKRVGYKVDYIITHCAPTSIAQKIHAGYDADALTEFLNEVATTVEFDHWYFGHYHSSGHVNDKFTLLYEAMLPLGAQ